MEALYERVVEREGRLAKRPELELVHSAEYLDRLEGWAQAAREKGRPIEVGPGLVISGASWDAARAAVGAVLTAVDGVLDGVAINGFCPVRPPGRDASAGAPGGYALLNSVAVAAKYLSRVKDVGAVLVLEWSVTRASEIAGLLDGDQRIGVARVREAGRRLEAGISWRIEHPGGQGGEEPTEWRSAPDVRLLQSADPAASQFAHAQNVLLRQMAAEPPEFVLLSAGFDLLDPHGGEAGPVTALEWHQATSELREWADRVCGGRLVTVLEGGYDAAALGAGAVQHMRGLTALEPVR